MRSGIGSSRVADGLDGGGSDETLLDHGVEVGEQPGDLFFRVDDAELDGRVLGERPMAGAADSAAGAVTFECREIRWLRRCPVPCTWRVWLRAAACPASGRLRQNECAPCVRRRVLSWQPRGVGKRRAADCRFFPGVERAVGVFDDVDVGEDNQTLLDHLVDQGEKGAKLFGGVDGR